MNNKMFKFEKSGLFFNEINLFVISQRVKYRKKALNFMCMVPNHIKEA